MGTRRLKNLVNYFAGLLNRPRGLLNRLFSSNPYVNGPRTKFTKSPSWFRKFCGRFSKFLRGCPSELPSVEVPCGFRSLGPGCCERKIGHGRSRVNTGGYGCLRRPRRAASYPSNHGRPREPSGGHTSQPDVLLTRNGLSIRQNPTHI